MRIVAPPPGFVLGIPRGRQYYARLSEDEQEQIGFQPEWDPRWWRDLGFVR